MPVFGTPETAVELFSDISGYYDNQNLLLQAPSPDQDYERAGSGNARVLADQLLAEQRRVPSALETRALLRSFGIEVKREGWEAFVIPAGSRYRSPGEVFVEGDASSASYFVGLGAIAATDAPMRIEGVGSESLQGDVRSADSCAGWVRDVVARFGGLHILVNCAAGNFLAGLIPNCDNVAARKLTFHLDHADGEQALALVAHLGCGTRIHNDGATHLQVIRHPLFAGLIFLGLCN